jgi:hypothetical protein
LATGHAVEREGDGFGQSSFLVEVLPFDTPLQQPPLQWFSDHATLPNNIVFGPKKMWNQNGEWEKIIQNSKLY